MDQHHGSAGTHHRAQRRGRGLTAATSFDALHPHLALGAVVIGGVVLVVSRWFVAGAMALGLAALVAVAWATDLPRTPLMVGLVCASPLLAWAIAGCGPWLRPAVLLLVLGVAMAGGWATLPDTEGALVVGAVVGVWLVATLVDERVWRGPPAGRRTATPNQGAIAWWPFALAVAWAVADGARGRTSSAVGAMAAWAVPVALALATLVGVGQAVRPLARGRAAALLFVHVGATLVAARMAGLRADLAQALLIAGVDVVVALVATWAIVSRPAPSASP